MLRDDLGGSLGCYISVHQSESYELIYHSYKTDDSHLIIGNDTDHSWGSYHQWQMIMMIRWLI